MDNTSDSNGSILTVGLVFLLGAALGAGIGLMLAPKPGAETRAMLAEKAHEAKEKAAEAAEMVREKASMMRNRVEGRARASEA
jgi:gas vesicle protein